MSATGIILIGFAAVLGITALLLYVFKKYHQA